MPTLTEIAKLAGVSPAVVSRVVNGDQSLRISRETLERVRKVVRETGYMPNRAARSLRSTRTGLIALVVHDVTNPIYAGIAQGAAAAAAAAGKAVLLSDASAGEAGAARLLELVGGRGVDGLILQADHSPSDQVLARAARENVPTVLLQAALKVDAPVVTLPDEAAARLATTHLLARGHRRIGCIATAAGLSFTGARISGWRAALSEAGIVPRPGWLRHAAPTLEAGRDAVDALRAAAPELTAILCCNALAGIGAMSRALDQGVRVPADCAFVALHDIPLAQHVRVPLSVVAMPLFELGSQAVETLLANDARGTVRVAAAPRLVQRESS